MSTTIKRVALVAVAALSFGVVSVVPSQAADNTVLQFEAGDSAGADNSVGYGVAGAFNYVTVKTVSPATDYVLTTDTTFLSVGTGTNGVLSTDAKSLSATAAGTGIRVATPAVGSVTVKYWVRTNGILAATAAESVVITVNASAVSKVYNAAKSSAYIVKGETTTATADATIAAPVSSSATISDTAAATIVVKVRDALGNAVKDTVTATVVSGGAFLAGTRDTATVESTTAAAFKATAGTTQVQVAVDTTTATSAAFIGVYAGTLAGPSVIRLTLSDGTVIGEKTVTFSSLTAASVSAVVKKAFVGVGETAKVFAVTVKDSAGNTIQNVTAPTMTVSTGNLISTVPAAACAWDTTDLVWYCSAKGTAATFGKGEYTFTVGTAKTTAAVTYSSPVAATLTIEPSATSVQPGEKITYTLTAKDANGYAIPDDSYVGVFVASSTNSASLVGAVPFSSDTVTTVSGVATSSTFAPASGSLTLTWTLKGTAGGAATANLAAGLVGTTITKTVTINNAAVDAATDAANEATDAANAATDAANAAAEAADAATAAAQDAADAVAALSTQVNELISALKKQITSLTAIVVKIQKKLGVK